MKYKNIREEELKNKVSHHYFGLYDCTKIIGNVDFCVAMHQSQKELAEPESLLWAEAKKDSSDVYKSIVQLILTIGKARTFDKFLPPAMLGAFDGEKMAFIPYNEIHEVFYQNDFNWNVTPSNYETREFQLIQEKVKNSIDSKALLFNYEKDEQELKKFIKNNFVVGKFGVTKTKIDKNNFVAIYNKWVQAVKPTIGLKWDALKKSADIIDGDFYLSDLLSIDNLSLKDKLYVFLKKDHYELERTLDDMGMFQLKRAFFLDKQVAHTQFWNKYERPPKEEYWDYIVERRDLLVPQDVRERKGSFFTPQIWVELSQKYLSDVLGEDWQDNYYVWDCAAGTGNLLTGLTNKYNIWASTLDKQDVEVMHDRIKNGANLLDEHVFQFDFLNDDFSKLPKPLQNIINNPKKQKKLVIYINPPYAEAATADRLGNKIGISDSLIKQKYGSIIGNSVNELFAQFFIRINNELPFSTLAEFSKLKIIQGKNFLKFRKLFLANFKKGFVVPANTFDNVKGDFPIGFMIWDLSKKNKINKVNLDVFENGSYSNYSKDFYTYDNIKGFLNDWYSKYYDRNGHEIGIMNTRGNDFQNKNYIHFSTDNCHNHTNIITQKNLIVSCIYLSIRQAIKSTWLNDRDQFLYPNDSWQNDAGFQNNCLAFALFHSQNKISSKYGTNHWIPFTEYQVGSREKFDSNFMTDFMRGKLKPDIVEEDLFGVKVNPIQNTELEFSTEAKEVFMAGRELWKYYHKQPNCNVNASLYDIREHFQGRNHKGKMNTKSENETYMFLIANLRDKLKILAEKIEPKVYEFEFLKQ